MNNKEINKLKSRIAFTAVLKIILFSLVFILVFIILIDGILQEYALEPQGIPAEQHTVKVEDKKTILSVFFIPKIDEKKQKHRIHFLCMYDPGRQPENGSGSYGNSHKISQVMPWELVLTGTCEKTKEKIVPEKMDTISKEKRKEYEHGNENGKSDNELDEGIRFETERNHVLHSRRNGR